MNTSPEIVQIVPRLGMVSDGVADYAKTLAEALRVRAQIGTWFLQGNPMDGEGHDSLTGNSARLEERSAAKVILALENRSGSYGNHARTNVLLHYANYGFSPRGCPFWLINGLELWKRRNPQATLIIMFHELYASGPPWRSSFWLSPVQRHLAGRLARLCDFAITSSGFYGRKLADWAPAKPERIMVQPVFSTIGEPVVQTSWNSRPPWLAVLGRAGTEVRVYDRHRQALATMVRALDIEEIIDIGLRARPVPSEVEGITVRTTGLLPREEVSTLLSACRAGFLDYPSDVVGKSTVFAAYCAHQVVPVITQVRGQELDGLRVGQHFLLARAETVDSPLTAANLEKISSAASDWYQGHAIAVQAAALSEILV